MFSKNLDFLSVKSMNCQKIQCWWKTRVEFIVLRNLIVLFPVQLFIFYIFASLPILFFSYSFLFAHSLTMVFFSLLRRCFVATAAVAVDTKLFK